MRGRANSRIPALVAAKFSKANNVIDAPLRELKSLPRLLDAIPHIAWSAGPDGRIDFISRKSQNDYASSSRDLLGEAWFNYVHTDDKERVVAAWVDAKGLPAPYKDEFRLELPNGGYGWVCVRGTPETAPDGKILGWIGTCTDVTDRVVAREALEESERLYRSVLQSSPDCIKVLNLKGQIELMNSPGLDIMQIEDFEQIRGAFWDSLWPKEMRASVRAALAKALDGETARFNGFCPTAANTPKWWDVIVTPMRGSDDKVSRLLVTSRDMTADKKKSQDLAWTSEHDALTSLPNRRAFQNRLHAAALRAMNSGEKLGLLIVDLDHFKHVNDSLGHAAGDALLTEFSARLRQSVRDTDFVARVGGDEFAVVMENVRDGTDLLRTGNSISERLRAPLKIEGRVLSSGASIGGALFPDDATQANELFKVADTALYALKSEGRGGIKLFKSHMREEAQRVSSQLSLARIALTEASVVPHYQVKVDLRSRQARGMEALLRWKHPQRGMQPPETIQEAFKDYGLASKIGDLMQCKVFADIRMWRRQGLKFGRVSINAAPVEFLRDDFAEQFIARMCRYGVDPSLIELEVTEHVLMERGSQYVARALMMLKEQGIRIALDDFGTGYSSLSHLRDYPVDVVKIDKSFVEKMGKDREIEAIVRAVVNLASSLNIKSVAEGVETAEQAELLELAGCNLGQGYLFGRAVDAEVVALSHNFRSAAC